MRFDFCGHISSSFVKRNQRRVTPETSDWLGGWMEGDCTAGGGGGEDISVSVLGVCEGGNYLMARTCRTLLGGNHALHVVVAVAVDAAASAGSCVKFFFII